MQINIINANVILPNETLRNACIVIQDGIISQIDGYCQDGFIIDAAGGYLMPGIIDIHSDHIEQVVEPRSGSVIDVGYALQEQDKYLANCGITTMYQSLSLWRPSGRGKASRESDTRNLLIREILNPVPDRLVSHKLHLRLDITYLDIVQDLLVMINEGLLSLLSFMDHTPGQGQYRDIERQRESMKSSAPNLSDEVIEEILINRMNTVKIPSDTLSHIAFQARSMGVSIASHDDDSAAKVDSVKANLGATISEFPVEPEVAQYAKSVGMTTLAGAPNVVRGESHSGNMSATEGILDGSITALCSDYYPPAMLKAIFKMHKQHGLPMHECVNLITLVPAQAVGICDHVGSITEGKVADLIIVDSPGEYPRLISTIKSGNVVSTINYSRKNVGV